MGEAVREIKFRVYHKKHKTMIYAPLACVGDDPYTKDHIEIVFTLGGSYCDIYFKDDARENVEIMQFTGLHDRNGKEIYEGDILKNGSGRIAKVEWFTHAGTWDAEALTSFGNSSMFSPNLWRYTEVIGNVWENAELLK